MRAREAKAVPEVTDRIDKAPPRRFRPYPEHRDSGVEWLGEIPAHWEIERLKYLATLNDEALAESTNPNFEMDYVDIGSVDAVAGITGTEAIVFEKAPSRARRVVRSGDVIVSTVRTYLRAIAAIEAPGSNLIVSTGFAVVRPRRLESSFASYSLRAPHFVERVVANSVGVSYPAINAGSLACFPIAYPSVDEQRSIATFLDRETAKIDGLVANKERLIELLGEKRTALITRAVTRGLDSNVAMKDSGVEWLGEIPAHWEIERLKYLATLNDEALAESTNPNFEMDYVDIGSVDAVAGITGTEAIVFEKAPSRARRVVRSGDVIVSTVRTYLRAIAAIEAPGSNLIVSTGFAVVRPRRLESSFASYSLRAPHFVERVVANSVGVSYPAINAGSLACFPIAYPSVDEQRSIADFLDRETAKIDALIAKVREALGHLREFRTALISAAVTGKIDVRGQAA